MKKAFLALVICAIFIMSNVHADEDDFLGKITMSVVRDQQQTEPLLYNHITKVETKILSLISKFGISGQGYSSDFIITPRMEIYDENLQEGMQNLYVITIDLNLFAKQSSTGIVYSTYNQRLIGTGTSRNAAITSAINRINVNDKDAEKFILTTKNKIIAFYNSKCNEILAQADKYLGMNQFDEALVLLMSVPVEASVCFDRVKGKSIEVFKKQQQKNCQSQILLAKSQISGNNFWNALGILSLIDPTSSCFKEANTLISQTESKLDAQEKIEWTRERELYKDRITLEKFQIQAARDVAISYYQRKPEYFGSIWNFLR
jgi:hypothetical protein